MQSKEQLQQDLISAGFFALGLKVSKEDENW
jgi:hypothetical protein